MPIEQTDPASGDTPASPAAVRVARWEESGGTWRVAGRTDRSVTVSLCQCDGGEEVERFASSEPALLQYLGGRASSED